MPVAASDTFGKSDIFDDGVGKSDGVRLSNNSVDASDNLDTDDPNPCISHISVVDIAATVSSSQRNPILAVSKLLRGEELELELELQEGGGSRVIVGMW